MVEIEKKDNRLSARVDNATKSRYEAIAARRGIDISDVVREALTEYLEKGTDRKVSTADDLRRLFRENPQVLREAIKTIEVRFIPHESGQDNEPRPD